jgi:MATE family multidrug resistance protein
MLACGLVYFFARRPLIHLFTEDPEVAAIGMTLLVFAALYQICDAMYIIYNGALRGAGDTFIPSIVTGVLVWGLMLFGGYLVARAFPKWGVAGPWTVATLYGLILGVFMWWRFTTGRWQSVNLEQDTRPDTVDDPANAAVPAAAQG